MTQPFEDFIDFGRYCEFFNKGYTLQKHEPDLLKKILKSENQQKSNFEALSEGAKQFKREQLIKQQKAITEAHKQTKKPKR